MKIENIKSNGISHHAPIKQVVGATLSTAVSLYKMRHTTTEIFSKFPKGDNYHAGRRFNNNDDVVIRICSALSEAARKEYLDNKTSLSRHNYISESDELLLQGIINSFIDSLSGREMDMIILDGLRDCASADHWYTFEKEWD